MNKEVLRLNMISSNSPLYGGLNDVTFSVLEKEIIAINGNHQNINGINAILKGQCEVTNGSIYVNSKKIEPERGLYEIKEICFISGKNTFNNSLNIMENIVITGDRKLFDIVDYQKNFDQILDIVKGLEINLRIKNYDELDSLQFLKFNVLKEFINKKDIFVFEDIPYSYTINDFNEIKKVFKFLNEKGKTIVFYCGEYLEYFNDIISKELLVRMGFITNTVFFDKNKELNQEEQIQLYSGSREVSISINYFEGEESPYKLIRKDDGEVFKLKTSSLYGILDRTFMMQNISDFIDTFNKRFEIYKNNIKIEIDDVSDLLLNRFALFSKENDSDLIVEEFDLMENIGIMVNGLVNNKGIRSKNIDKWAYNNTVKKFEIFKHLTDLDPEEKCYNLSSLQKNEIFMAKWLAINPEILFVVVPMNYYDLNTAKRIDEVINDLLQNGKIVVIIMSNFETRMAKVIKSLI